jgi:hypothetical protein
MNLIELNRTKTSRRLFILLHQMSDIGQFFILYFVTY